MGKWRYIAKEPRTGVLEGSSAKRCPVCQKMTPLNGGFHRNRTTKDGFACYCRTCTPIVVAPFINREKARQVAKLAWSTIRNDPTYWQRKRAYYSRVLAPRYRCDVEERRKIEARWMVYYAVKYGTLKKPAACSSCGRGSSGHGLQAHHTDYSKPLEVRWLCTACHGKTHRKYGHKSLPEEQEGAELPSDHQGDRGTPLPSRVRAEGQAIQEIQREADVPVPGESGSNRC